MVSTVLLAFAFVFACFAAAGRNFGWVHTGWLGFVFFIAALLAGALVPFLR